MRVDARRLLLLATAALGVAATTRGQDTEEPLRLVHADVLRNEIRDGRVVRIVAGNVEFQQGDARMTCDRAEWYVNEGRSVFLGNVVITEGETRLTAARVDYDDSLRTALATGQVVWVDENHIVNCDSLWYYEPDDRAILRGKVAVTDTSGEMVLTGGFAEYFREQERIRMREQPVLVQLDSLGRERVRITSDEMEILEQGARSKAIGQVVVTKDSTVGRSQEAEYFRDDHHFVLRGDAVATQGNDVIRGGQIDLWLVDDRLDWVEVVDGAQVISPIDTLEGVRLENSLNGERMQLYLEEEKLRKVVIFGRAHSVYHAIEDGELTATNEAIGDTMTLQFDAGKLVQITILSSPGKSKGRVYPPGQRPPSTLAPSRASPEPPKAKGP